MFEYDFTVQYVDIDSNNNLSDYGIFKYLQEIACLHSDSCGFGLYDTPKNRLAWIILNWKLTVFSRPGWNAKLHVKTWPSKIDNLCCFRDFEIKDDVGNIIAVASSKWVLINVDTHHIAKITQEIRDAFPPILGSVFDEELQKLKEPYSYEKIFDYTILRRDIDTNNHLNNLNYVLLAKQALPDEVYRSTSFNNIEVMYSKQCVLGDSVSFCCHKENDGEFFVSVKNIQNNVLHAIIKFGF